MQDAVQNSRSPFRELRLKAGYKQQRPLARALGVQHSTIKNWDLGSRPDFKCVRDLAQLFRIDVTEAVRLIWNERVGDPCDCSCGHEKVLPDSDKAKHLYTKVVCEKCGEERKEPRGKRTKHLRKLCAGCYRARVERIELTCVHGQFHGSEVISERCPGKREFLPRRLKHWRHIRNDERSVYVDLDQRTYRSRWCAGLLTLIHQREKDLKEQWNEATRGTIGIPKNFPRIRSLADLDRVQSELYKHAEFRKNIFLRKSAGPPKRTGPKPGYTFPDSTGFARWWRRKKLPGVVQGLCRICDTLLLRYMSPASKKRGPMRFHRKCLLNYQREHRGSVPEERRRRGAPVRLESLQIHFAMAILHKVLNDSLGKIAKDLKVQKNAVVEGIAFIKSHLPALEVVPPRFRQIVSLLGS